MFFSQREKWKVYCMMYMMYEKCKCKVYTWSVCPVPYLIMPNLHTLICQMHNQHHTIMIRILRVCFVQETKTAQHSLLALFVRVCAYANTMYTQIHIYIVLSETTRRPWLYVVQIHLLSYHIVMLGLCVCVCVCVCCCCCVFHRYLGRFVFAHHFREFVTCRFTTCLGSVHTYTHVHTHTHTHTYIHTYIHTYNNKKLNTASPHYKKKQSNTI